MAANQFFFWSRENEPRPIVPADLAVNDTDPTDLRYFARILQETDALLGQRGITFLLTWNLDQFDSRFDNAVVILVGDEQNQTPTYAPRVRAIFKTGGVRPNPIISWAKVPFHLGWRLGLREIRNRVKSIRRGRGHAPGRNAPMYDIPLGYFRLLDLPFIPFDERPVDVFFAGGVPAKARLQLRASLAARSDLAKAVQSVEVALPQAKVEFSMMPGGRKYGPQSYSEMLMRSKIMLCPRGNIDETYRLLEAARSGCVLISEPLPARWYYESLPAVQIRSWKLLVPTLRELLSDQGKLERLSAQTREWWDNFACERAVAQYIVKQLSSLKI